MKRIRLQAPAKVNYRLDVIRRRPDNYHDLRMVMQRISLYDEIDISLTDTPGIQVICGKVGVPDGPTNIAWKAADILLSKAGAPVGIRIGIQKNIPVAAGLGGGSSDAATVLMGLNDLLDLKLSDAELMKIGLKLGADVPFFIFKKTALAEGIGEQLTEIEGLPTVWLVLVNPKFPVSTAWVYQNLQLTNRPYLDTLPKFCDRIEDIIALLSNDLESVTIERFPVIREIKELLLANGALGALMSGSGPTVFAVFETEAHARACLNGMSKHAQWFSVVAQTI
jgi:4-diphosphocytidyl-2-C-methyl-D-erythritol kinase